VFERLRLISYFKGGNKKIIEKGMSLLALNMINDYKRDIPIDEAIGKYNPMADDSMNHMQLKAKLIKKITSVDCPEMDNIIKLEGPGTQDYWGW
jgi:hypothetical protein